MFHCSVIKVPVILATAILDYHNQEGLSRTFFIFLKLFSQAISACFCLFSTASLDYHISLGLSRTFLKFFNFFKNFFEKNVFLCHFDSLFTLSYLFFLVNNFFHFLFWPSNLKAVDWFTLYHYPFSMSTKKQENFTIFATTQLNVNFLVK